MSDDQIPTDPSNDPNRENRAGSGGRYLRIDSFNYSPNDIDSLAKLASKDPKLAEKVIDGADKAHQREHGTERFGMSVTATLLALVVASVVVCIIFGGILKAIGALVVIVGLAFFVAVAVTGEWQETNWIGGLIDAAIRASGGKVPNNEEETNDPPTE